jgi:DNA modification methylase
MKTVTLPLDKLIAYAGNPRKNDHAVEAVASAIKRFGFRVPVLAKSDGSLIDGHLRVKAAKHLGMKEVPVVLCDDLSEADIKALRISINRMAELAEWDTELLSAELEGLAAEGIGLEDVGFSADYLEELGADLGLLKGNPEADAEPQIDKSEELRAKWGVEPGQLWELGEHWLLCGDSTKKEDVERVMGGEKADACVTDPPYGIGVDAAMHKQSGTQYGKAAAPKRHYALTNWDKLPPQSAIDNAASFATSVIFGGNYFSLPPSRCWLVWDKENGDNAFADCELAWTNIDQPVRIKRHMWNGMIRKGKEERTTHPTQKPVAVIAWCVAMTSGVVFDPFSGSGTTIIACEQLGRKCRAIEISPAYVAVALQRWADATGKTPRLVP